jgi:hypothetical protein
MKGRRWSVVDTDDAVEEGGLSHQGRKRQKQYPRVDLEEYHDGYRQRGDSIA